MTSPPTAGPFVESLDKELRRSQQEIDRLVKNRAAFYEIMTDMIFLIKEDYVIEDMNQSAIATFGDLRGQLCYKALFHCATPCEFTCPVKQAAKGLRNTQLIERLIGKIFVEYSFVPFHGYQGDNLVMIVMRDISRRKQHELEIAEFNNNIEAVLRQKIADLSESEKYRHQLLQELNVLQKELERISRPDEMVGESRRIRELREMIYQVADTNATILITGESGTGKELIADLIVKHSSRRNKPFLKINCAAITETLLESDLFGYERGSFTGAATTRKGKFEIADGGTIFLDEIGDISPKMQAALLRVLQNGEIIRVGGNTPVTIDVRVIAATNVELADAVEQGRFRKDLFYRLNVINLRQPPLRERKEDIILLTKHFIRKYEKAFSKEIKMLPEKILNIFLNHSWPGNIRELENVIQRAVLLSRNNTITEKDLDFDRKPAAETPSKKNDVLEIDERIFKQPLKDTMAELEKRVLSGIIQKWDGKVNEVAKVLDIGKTALYTKLKRYGISPKNLKLD